MFMSISKNIIMFRPEQQRGTSKVKMRVIALAAAVVCVAALAINGPAFAAGYPGEQDTLDGLTAGANGVTMAAAVLLASQEVCGYPHNMLAGAIADAKAGGVDDERVVAIAYQLSIMAAHDMRAKNIVCSGAMKIVNENNAQRRAGVPQ